MSPIADSDVRQSANARIAAPPSVVYRYRLPTDKSDFVMSIPLGAQFCAAQVRQGEGDSVDMWCLINPDAPLRHTRFRWVGTGHNEVQPGDIYLGTVQLSGGSFVLHLFEVRG